MRCIHCQHDNRSDAPLCERCGQPPAGLACPACGAPNLPSGRFCSACGQALRGALPGLGQVSPSSYTPAHLAEKILVSRSALEGEHKQVTVLFCDIANSTPLTSSLGAEQMHALLNRFFGLALEAVHRYEGTINQFLGDGFMALFGAPISHEDHAVRAVLAALDIQHALRERQRELVPSGDRVTVRMGLNSGPVVVGKIGDNLRMDYTAVGDTTNVAARLQQLALPDVILVSDTMQRVIAPHVESVALGPQTLKGLQAQVVHRVVAGRPGTTRFHAALHRGLSPFLSRSKELMQLRIELEQACSGSVRIVSVEGEPGIGKSRLIHEFCQGVSPEGVTLVRGDCVAYGGARALLPFIQVVRQLCGAEDRDPSARLSEKCSRMLDEAGLDDAAGLPLLLNLLGSDAPEPYLRAWDPELIAARTRQLLLDLLVRLAARQPVLVVVEDLQWSDAASIELLSRLANSAQSVRLLLLVSFRRGYSAPWAERPNAVALALAPLPDDACRQLILARLGVQIPTQRLQGEIVSKAEGNPLFAEELVHYLSASGVSAGAQLGARADTTLLVPSTVQDLVMARVDRLPEHVRSLLRTAAVVGRRFGQEVVQRASGVNGHAVEYLEQLEHQDLIRFEPPPERHEYIFKHALIQEAIYDSLLSAQRAALHQRVAETLEEEYPDRLREWSDVLAHHYSRTTQHQKAARYLVFSGERHLQASSVVEAERCFREAIRCLESQATSTDPVLIDAVLDLGYIYYYRHDLFGMERLIQQYRTQVDALGDVRQRGKLWLWIQTVYVDSCRIAAAEDEQRAFAAYAEASGDPWCVACACMCEMWLRWMRRADHPVEIVARLAERAIGALQHAPDVYLHSQILLCLAIDYLSRGRMDDARRTVADLVRSAGRAGNSRTQAFGLYMRAYADVFMEDFEEAIELSAEAAAISPNPFDRLCALGIEGTALTLMGRADAGLRLLSAVRNEIRSGNFLMLYLFYDIPYGVALVLAGRMAQGVRFIEAAIARFTEWGNDTQPAFGHLVLGDIYTQIALGEQKPPLRVLLRNLGFVFREVPLARRKAHAHLRQAVELAARIGNDWLEGQARFHLAKLQHAAGHTAEAQAQLHRALRLAEPLGSNPLLGKIAALRAAVSE
jgi:class 3 adenylate cyclase/tetratricopeptide (TPR) repeat protein